MSAFERSKWLREEMIYLELFLCFAPEGRHIDVCGSNGFFKSFSGDTHM